MTQAERLQARYFADLLDSLKFLSWPAPALPFVLLLIPSGAWSSLQWGYWLVLLGMSWAHLFFAWHLHLDGLLFRSLSQSEDDGSGLDGFLFMQWRKSITNKSLAQRIAGSQQLIKRCLFSMVIFWASLLLWRLLP